MKKFDFFNRFRDPVFVVRDYDDVVFKNNTFCRVFNQFTDIKKFAHKMTFEMCPMDSENADLYSPLFQAITSKENFFARICYTSNAEDTRYYDLTSVKRGAYTIIFLSDVSADIILKDNKTEQKLYLEQLKKLKEENNELQKIRQKAQTQAFKIGLINKVSNIISESMDISAILNSVLKELSMMFGCFRAYYAKCSDNIFNITESYGEKSSSINTVISFDETVTNKLLNRKISVGYALSEYTGAIPFKKSVLRIIVPIYHMQKMIGIIVLLSYQKRELNEEIEILDAVASQLGSAIIRAELYKRNAQNVQELKHTLKELKDTQVQLINSEKMASLGQLIAGIAHEINTPVAAIKSNNEMLSKLSSKIENSDIKDMFNQILSTDKEAITRISKIVVSLKKFVRLDGAELQEADINKEIDLTLDIISHETKNKVEIIKDYGNIPKIKCYPNLLNQVFTNILVNACQSIEKTGTITISTHVVRNTLEIRIKDSGSGIPKENLNKIFTAGFTTKGVGVGTGLGLAISQKIIDKHHGKIRVLSEVGVGTEFIITIPC
ncbi:MAG TPA: hypothetical protein DEO94_04875 [Cyanobacteria bacterium UBA11991]|nr:ATP-binding protein [Cyanobacteriota bacterium]MDY6358193.1 ATP-binding protein [Cyanobacteriota bacterium]MDY6364757.1 ATP-binding protein [Cyanobacteriota bacterium]MDY6383127.1 ATP-binding protein [Cyanobacteriota bacterium]HCB11456.1 hypothetical protein [Cyanobacteria bacterium UBA11991]